MPLCPTQTDAPAPFLEALCANSRMFLVGVERYTRIAARPVHSARNNIAAWVIQALRMGISPHGNHVLVDSSRREIRQTITEVLVESDLSADARSRGRVVTDGWRSVKGEDARYDDWSVVRPTFKNVLRYLVEVANHLQWKLDGHRRDPSQPCTRLLFVFSGHGALSQGRFVLCPSDAELACARPAASVEGRKRWLLRAHPEAEAALKEAFEVAEDRGACAELLDVLEASGVPFDPRLSLTVAALTRNLRALPAPDASLPAPTYTAVLTAIHLQLILGDLGSLVTMVVDACHSGGGADALQGSAAISDWTKLGLPCRVISASRKHEIAAEATLGQRRFSAATWALTSVLSRWEAIEDEHAYAVGISHGNLLMRANLLLDALSLNQRLSLSAPASERRVADLPFFGQSASTLTTVDPNADADGIQLDSDSPRVWEIRKGGLLRAALMVCVNRSDSPNMLYVFGDASTAADLQGAAFTMRMVTAHVNNPAAELSWYQANGAPSFKVLASTQAAPATEQPYPTNPAPSTSGYVSYQHQSARRVWMRWQAATATQGAALVFVLDTAAAYNQQCFDEANLMNFAVAETVPFDSTWFMATIPLVLPA